MWLASVGGPFGPNVQPPTVPPARPEPIVTGALPGRPDLLFVDIEMPDADGFAWTGSRATALTPARLG